MTLRMFTLLFTAFVITVPQCRADQVLYDNGPIKGDTAWAITTGQFITDSFVLKGAATVTGFEAGMWVRTGDNLLTVDWSITSDPFGGTVFGSGTASMSNSFFLDKGNFQIYESTATGLDVPLPAGTYFLQLQNGISSQGKHVLWDENDGPSSAFASGFGAIGSESFQVIGASVPEPSECILFASGIAVIFRVMRRRSIP